MLIFFPFCKHSSHKKKRRPGGAVAMNEKIAQVVRDQKRWWFQYE